MVKRTGDGALVEFRSVVESVRCAIEVQEGMIERNAGLPADRRIEFRIGIHLGDVVEESDGDLMGDSVNIAARLEGIASPGGARGKGDHDRSAMEADTALNLNPNYALAHNARGVVSCGCRLHSRQDRCGGERVTGLPLPSRPCPRVGRGAQDELTYDVRFRSEDLWPNSADAALIHVGVFQSYRERVT